MKTSTIIRVWFFATLTAALFSSLQPTQASAQFRRRPDVISVTGAFDFGLIDSGSGRNLALLGVDGDVRYYMGGRNGLALRLTAGTDSLFLGEARYSLRFASNDYPSRGISLSGNFDFGAGMGRFERSGSNLLGPNYSETYLPVFGVFAVNGSLHLSIFTVSAEFGVRAGAAVRTHRSGEGTALFGDTFWAPYGALRAGVAFNI